MQSPDSHACHTALMTGPPHHSLQVGMVGMAQVTGSVLASYLFYSLTLERGRRRERHQFVTYAFIGWFSRDRGWNLQPWHIRTTLQPSSVSVLSLLRCDLPSGRCVVHSLGALPGGRSQSKKATPRLLPPGGSSLPAPKSLLSGKRPGCQAFHVHLFCSYKCVGFVCINVACCLCLAIKTSPSPVTADRQADPHS